jgi:hypothetical protein
MSDDSCDGMKHGNREGVAPITSTEDPVRAVYFSVVDIPAPFPHVADHVAKPQLFGFINPTSCSLLSDQIRETKLQTAPIDQLRTLEKFIRQTDDVVLSQVAYFVFWLVRFERARRTGSAELRV